MGSSGLKIVFLGTGTSSGVPMIACKCRVCTSPDPKDKRLRSSIMVESDTTRLVVDTTPDFRYQMLRANVDRLDAVIFTHPHKDHIAGLDDIRAFNYFQQQSIRVFANQLTQMAIRREFAYIFSDEKYPGIPQIDLIDINDQPFVVGDIEVTPIKVWHLNMPVLGFRFGRFTYITDANRIEEKEQQKILGSEYLVLNALRNEAHISHFTLGEAVALSRQLHIPQARFTHISHQLGRHQEVNNSLPENMELAFDNLVIFVD